MNKAYLLIGGNKGDRFHYLQQALTNIELFCGRIIQLSGRYETAAWGKTDQPSFLNQALLADCVLEAPELMNRILDVEKKLGRERQEKYAARTIDIDILFFNEAVIHMPQLNIPHPEIQNRRFVLAPMNEIAPDLIHPVLNLSIHQLLTACTDPLEVKRIN